MPDEMQSDETSQFVAYSEPDDVERPYLTPEQISAMFGVPIPENNERLAT